MAELYQKAKKKRIPEGAGKPPARNPGYLLSLEGFVVLSDLDSDLVSDFVSVFVSDLPSDLPSEDFPFVDGDFPPLP